VTGTLLIASNLIHDFLLEHDGLEAILLDEISEIPPNK
jgi:hypothetical protein